MDLKLPETTAASIAATGSVVNLVAHMERLIEARRVLHSVSIGASAALNYSFGADATLEQLIEHVLQLERSVRDVKAALAVVASISAETSGNA